METEKAIAEIEKIKAEAEAKRQEATEGTEVTTEQFISENKEADTEDCESCSA